MRRWLSSGARGTALQRSVRGTHDALPEDARKLQFVKDTARSQAELYGFSRVQTPTIEHAALFERTLGASSDVIQKEMFRVASGPASTSVHRDDEGAMVLRPEGTAGVMRAFLSGANSAVLPQRWYYSGSMFRYERPQRGRFREFGQFGVEVLGSACVSVDAEGIRLAWDTLSALGLGPRARLQLNTIGDAASRRAYQDTLHTYLLERRGDLSTESQNRVDRGMDWRVLDSKSEQDAAVISGAPPLHSMLSVASIERFEQLKQVLEAYDVPYSVNPSIVRGLDYYCETVFEFVLAGEDVETHAGTILAGGRYDGLAEQMGGKKTPGFGWAAGIERLSLAVPPVSIPQPPRSLSVILKDGSAQSIAAAGRLAGALRSLGVSVALADSTITASRQLAKVAKQGFTYAAWADNDGSATIRDLTTRHETRFSTLSSIQWPPSQ